MSVFLTKYDFVKGGARNRAVAWLIFRRRGDLTRGL